MVQFKVISFFSELYLFTKGEKIYEGIKRKEKKND